MKRLIQLITLLLALLGLHGHAKPAPAAPSPATAPQAAPAPPSVAPTVTGPPSCAVGTGYRPDGSHGYYATCVTGGQQQTLGTYPTRAQAQRAVRAFLKAYHAAR
jgi:hypothetical protein